MFVSNRRIVGYSGFVACFKFNVTAQAKGNKPHSAFIDSTIRLHLLQKVAAILQYHHQLNINKNENCSIHIIKPGHKIKIREGNVLDSERLMLCAKSYLKSNLIPMTPEEFNLTIEEHQKWISHFLEGKNDWLLMAEFEGQIIGNIDLTIRHR